MIKKWMIPAFGVWVVLGAFCAEGLAASYELDAQKTELHFDAKSSLHPFRGVASGLRGTASWDSANPALPAKGEVTIPVSGIVTGEKQRDKEMRAMFAEAEYPEIVFVLSKMQPGEKPGTFVLEGDLRIREVSKAVSIPVTLDSEGGYTRVRGVVPVLTTWFGLKPPSVLGIVRVLPEVKVAFDAYWREIAA